MYFSIFMDKECSVLATEDMYLFLMGVNSQKN